MIKLNDVLFQYENIVKYILVTDINIDGTMDGSNIKLYKEIKEKFPNFILQVSGWVSSLNDLKKLQKTANFIIVGKALYKRLIDKIYVD